MAEARERSGWARMSALLALIANAHRDAKKTRPFKPSDFDPYARRGESKANDIPALRALFTRRQQGTGNGDQTEGKEADG